MPGPASIRNRATLQRENQQLRTAAAEAASLAKAEMVSAGAVAKVHWPQWATAVLAVVASLAVAIVGGRLALAGTYFGAQEDRAKETREKRAQVYANYLAAARAYTAASEEFGDVYAQYGVTGSVRSAEGRRLGTKPDVIAVRKKFFAAEQAFDRQADLVYVYGSDAAWKAHRRVETEGLPVRISRSEDFIAADARRQAALASFQAIFCSEVTAEPRSGCA